MIRAILPRSEQRSPPPTPSPAFPRLALLLALPLPLMPAGCTLAPSQLAGSVPLPADATRTLHVEAPQRKAIVVELWNRGPGRVRFRSVAPTMEATTAGTLDPSSGDARWSVTAQQFVVELTADAAGATIGYLVRTTGSLTVDERRPPPPEEPSSPATPPPAEPPR